MIDWSKVAVFHNTQYSESQTVAEYYATARGIPAGNVQGYAMGPSDSLGGASNAARDAVIGGIFTDMDTFIAANGVEAVALSTHCPLYYVFAPETSPTNLYQKQGSLCRAISDVDRIVTLGVTTAQDAELPTYSSDTFYPNGSSWQAGDQQMWSCRLHSAPSGGPIADWRKVATTRNGYRHVFCGRIGYRTSISVDDSATASRCIDDAIWFEQNGDPINAPMLFGLSHRNDWLAWGQVWQAYHAAKQGMRNIETYDGNYLNSASSKYAAGTWGVEKPEITINDQATWLSGGGPVKDIWGWVGTGFENNANAYLPSVRFARGAWMFESTSQSVSRYSLGAGACAAILPLAEPLSDGVPYIGPLMRYLLRGFSLEESRAMAQPLFYKGGIMSEVWGDPFYAPFKKKKINSQGGVSIQ